MMDKKRTVKKKKKAPKKPKIDFSSWNTTDADEIERRRVRALLEKFTVHNTDPLQIYYSDFTVGSKSDKKYHVEIRSLDMQVNSCDCLDYRTNSLGTCKHVEYILHKLKKKGVRLFKRIQEQGSDRVEVYLRPTSSNIPIVSVQWPAKYPAIVKKHVEPFFSSDGSLLGDSVKAYDTLIATLSDNKKLKSLVRVSKHISYFIEYQRINSKKEAARAAFMKDVAAGKRSMNVVKSVLYPYQQEGLLHLTFTERALLADEMGLGKTIQAISACELLKQTRRIQRVLIVTTASLKAEWEEQIHRFTASPVHLIYGSRAARLKQYHQNAFFTVMNYEQVVVDYKDIQQHLAPDVVILDEAQRIKNWQTKTANKIKELKSRYAFVLTGTPVENRIDDIYSIVQFLDPHVFGSLFRFNRDYYDLDEDGRPIGYKNLDELYRRLRPVMLCRKKSDVEDELPSRTINNYFVTMEPEQRERYDEYEKYVSRLMQQAKRRVLRKEDFERLQRWLACMRMLCDTPYILDKKCKISPKLNELETILDELLSDGTTKIIIFSEWERMLMLIKDKVEEQGYQVSWHTGSVHQKKRREEINRFKEDKKCRVFLSTDAGSVGLNLQVANVVINVDLPWNPAKLEQRIARAWRKHQTRSVQVINLISENSIEHRMLYLLEQKQLMAKGVLTGDEALKSMKMPSGRAAFMERMEALLADADRAEILDSEDDSIITSTVDSNEEKGRKSHDIFVDQVSEDLSLLHEYQHNDKKVVLAVVDELTDELQEQLKSHFNAASNIEVLDRKTFETIQRLIDLGILSGSLPNSILYEETSEQSQAKIKKQRMDKAQSFLLQAERKQKMAHLLLEGDFFEESLPPLKEASVLILQAFLESVGEKKHSIEELSPPFIKEVLIAQYGMPDDVLALSAGTKQSDPDVIKDLHLKQQKIAAYVKQRLNEL